MAEGISSSAVDNVIEHQLAFFYKSWFVSVHLARLATNLLDVGTRLPHKSAILIRTDCLWWHQVTG